MALTFCLGIGLGGPDLSTSGVLFRTALGGLIALFPRPGLASARRRTPGHAFHVALLLVPVLLAGVLHGAATRSSEPGSAPPQVTSVRSTAAGRTARVGGTGGDAVSDSTRAERARVRLDRRIRATFPAEGGLVSALLLAERDGVDREVRDAFRRSGTSHLLAISGFHVGVIAGWLVLLLRIVRIRRRSALAGTAVLVWAYVALLGFPGSASRAATIFTLVCAGRLLGRPVSGVAAWGTALLCVALVAPVKILEVGTRLSFLGALGLLVWAPDWTRSMRDAFVRVAERAGHTVDPRRLEGPAGAIAASAAAQWATIGLAAWSFQQVALAALPTTLVATPLVTVALPGALLALGLDALHVPGAAVVASGVEAFLALLRHVVVFAGHAGPVLLLTPLTVAAGVCAAMAARPAWRTLCRSRPPRGLVPVAVVSVLLTATPLAEAFGPREVELHFIDVGQGDAIAIRSRNGHWVLVDTGPPSGDRLVRELLRLGVGRIDVLALSHPDLDHIGGADAVLRAFPVGVVIDPVSVKGGAWRSLLSLTDGRGVPWRAGQAGDRFVVDGLSFEVLAPGPGVAGTEPGADTNDRSLVLRLRSGEFDALFTGDVPIAVEEVIAGSVGDVELLKVAHHGSRTSTAPALLDAIRPELAVIQVGRGNRFGHPAPEVVQRLGAAGADILRTDRHGRITVLPHRDGGWTVRTEFPAAGGRD